jgi:hypothetical protein
MPESHKIIRLEAENVLRLQAVEIHFDPKQNIYIIGGENEQGKSATLDAITMALGGQSKVPPKPIHEGKTKGHVVVELDNLIVTREFTDKSPKGYLKITTRDGKPVAGGPQKILDELIGKLTFDPLDFSRMDSKKQTETLLQLVGLDFAALDAEYKQVEEERRNVNREVKAIEARVAASPFDHDAPKKRLDVNELTAELRRRMDVNAANREKQNKVDAIQGKIAEIEHEIAELDKVLRFKKDQLQDLVKGVDQWKSELADLVDENEAEINQKITDMVDLNKRFDQNQQRGALRDEQQEKNAEADAYTEKLDAIKQQKTDALASAKFPLPGLAFDDEYGVTYKNKPFCQCSQAEGLAVSVAMGFALNPGLKLLLSRDGSFLDDKHLKLVADLAKQHDGQLILERVGKDKNCYVIIEDGKVL